MKMQNFGEMVVREGVCVQPGQHVVIFSPISCAEYARDVAEAAYRAGAADCTVQWNDPLTARIRYTYASQDALSLFPAWMTESRMHYVRQNACFVTLVSGDPDVFAGVDAAKLRAASMAANRALASYRRAITANQCAWCIVAAPDAAWARKIFPELPEAEAFAKLESAIAHIMRLDTANPLAALRENNRLLAARCEKLNALHLRTLVYRSGLGTDFRVDLPDGYVFQGGSEENQQGVRFTANIPTEEIFTAPDFRTAEGTLVASMPLSHNGSLVRDFRLTFREGKVVAYSAAEGQEVLENIFASDENARFLGELALVPHASPIAEMGLLFYSTLFDENASCHFAFGSAYPSCIEGGLAMSEAELLAHGINVSHEHVDFMVGTADLSVTGITRDGKEIPVMTDGNFAIG